MSVPGVGTTFSYSGLNPANYPPFWGCAGGDNIDLRAQYFNIAANAGGRACNMAGHLHL